MDQKNQLLQNEISALLKQCNLWFRQTRLNPHGRIVLNQVIKRLSEIQGLSEETPLNKLSKREKEILQHVANGFSNREIASALEISEKTIEYHLKSVFTKMEASTRTEAVSMAYKKGWI